MAIQELEYHILSICMHLKKKPSEFIGIFVAWLSITIDEPYLVTFDLLKRCISTTISSKQYSPIIFFSSFITFCSLL